MWDLIVTIVIGLLAGAVAKFIMPGKDPGGILITILLGIGGAVVFRYVGDALNIYPEGGFLQFVGAVIGAIVILVIYRAIRGRQQAQP
jgi:uncharacterized membrane protein YeaQ/YmgE (transglycosylase-associated protein family)